MKNEKKPTHIQEPLRIDEDNPKRIVDVQDCLVATCHQNTADDIGQAKANAEFIVKACNSHEEFVKCLKRVLACGFDMPIQLKQDIEQALEKAGG